MFTDKVKSLLFFLTATFSASFVGRIVTTFNKEPWYSELHKSNLTPPGWVFGVVWPTLYVLMAVAVWIAFTNKPKNKSTILKLYFMQLFLNATWTPVFFGMHSILGGLLIIPAMIIAIVLLMREYHPKQMISFYLMVPYWLWCCFALFLNFRLYQLN